MRGVVFSRIFLAAAISFGMVCAQAASVQAASLDWQKVGLEKELHDRLVKSLRVAVPENQFVATVTIALKPMPKNAPAPIAKKYKKSSDLPLGKLDLDAPLFDPNADSQGTDQAAAPSDEPSLFSQIASAAVLVILDRRVSADRDALAKSIASGVMAGVGKVPVSITVDRTDLVPPAPAPAPEKPKTWLDMLSMFKIPISLIAGTIILGLFLSVIGLFAVVAYNRLESRRIAVLEANDARKTARLEHEQAVARQAQSSYEVPVQGAAVAKALPDEQMAERGFDRLRRLVDDAPDRVAAMVRQWLKSPSKLAPGALCVVPQVLTTEQLTRVFAALTAEERRGWRKRLEDNVSEDMDAVQAFVSSQIVETLLVPQPVMEADSRQAIESLNIMDAMEIASEDAELGAALIHFLPPTLAARVFSMMLTERANEVTMTSLRLAEADLRQKLPQLKTAIEKQRARVKQVPFLDRAGDLIRQADADKESAIYTALAESGDWSALAEIARQFFPAELITRLPSDLLKSCLASMVVDRRAELLYVLEGETREVLMNAFAPANTKSREMIEVEIDRVKENELRKKQAERNRFRLWRDFTNVCRQTIQSNTGVREIADGLLAEWLSAKSGGAYGDASPSSLAA